jgi:hypothetical protein
MKYVAMQSSFPWRAFSGFIDAFAASGKILLVTLKGGGRFRCGNTLRTSLQYGISGLSLPPVFLALLLPGCVRNPYPCRYDNVIPLNSYQRERTSIAITSDQFDGPAFQGGL